MGKKSIEEPEVEEKHNESDDEVYEEEDDEKEEIIDKEDKEDEEDEEDEGKEETEEEVDDKCVYKFKDKPDVDETYDEYIFDDLTMDDEYRTGQSEVPKTTENITRPILFKFERVRILGLRAKQLQYGAKPMIKNVEGLNPKEIAKLELENKKIPFIIERTLPNGKKERFKISQLKI